MGEPGRHAGARLGEAFEALLVPLTEAGWEPDEDQTFGELDPQAGPVLWQVLHRTGMVLPVTWEPQQQTLTLEPYEDDWDDEFDLDLYGILDEPVTISLPPGPRAAETVRTIAQPLGLLDATRIDTSVEAAEGAGRLVGRRYAQFVIREASAWRGEAPAATFAAMQADSELNPILQAMGFLGQGVLPDPVPAAATLGIVAWCWRNDTEVENFHSQLPALTDVVMAKLNITMVRAVRPHVTLEGVDWNGVQAAVTEPTRRLADGRRLAELFGEGWAPTLASLKVPLGRWRRIEGLVGPQATLRLLTVAGSTGYTDHWWGTGWWPRLCQTAMAEIVAAGVTLPAPYDQQGLQALVAALVEAPDRLADQVLEVCIDPGKAADGRRPRGLRMTRVTPPRRCIQPLDLDDL